MSGGDRLFKPSERGRRDPVSDAQENGPIVNPPRYAKIGGFKSASQGRREERHVDSQAGGTK
jgi:hypothetical protein